MRGFSKSRENGAGEPGGERIRGQELQVGIRHLMIEGPQPLDDWREGPSLAPRAKHPAAPTCYSQPLCPPLSALAARRRAGGDFKCSHPSRGTSPAHVTAAWRRPCPPHPDPAPLPEGAPWPLRPDGADTAILHLTGRPGRNSL